MKEKLPVLLSAGFGGISPNLLRLAISLMNENAQLPGVTYLIGLLIFGVIGAVVALIWEETSYKKAFYLGIGLPAFIQMSAGEISRTQVAAYFNETRQNYVLEEKLPPESSWSIEPAMMQSQERQLQLNFDAAVPQFYVYFLSPDSSTSMQINLERKKRSANVKVPAFARTFRIHILTSISESIPIPDQPAPLKYNVSVQRSIWSGLIQAIGFTPDYQITITPATQEQPQ